ncbi:hypothetical protein J3R30DRAFT_3437961 [Lentinula aciculospora]|uniref:Fungal-type protein kinase domain-containing protein n=1 Tax=Lentinula aciculospora TaxID=153920 RepID=A0A9W9AL19_9AGAR|nr:hypothetical protein J3R30DRAFT_3437961 [Lentinula aciculospora]
MSVNNFHVPTLNTVDIVPNSKMRSTVMANPVQCGVVSATASECASEAVVVKIRFSNNLYLNEDEFIVRFMSDEYTRGYFPSIVPVSPQTIQLNRNEVLSDHLKGCASRCSIQQELWHLISKRSPAITSRQTAQVFYDIVQAHQWLYTKAEIIHGDVNPNNIKYWLDGDKIYGVLIHHDVPSTIDRIIRVQMDRTLGNFSLDMMSDVVGEFNKKMVSNPKQWT